MKVIPMPADARVHLNDLWLAYQDMHLRTLADPALLEDPEFCARMDRAHERYFRAFERPAA